MMRPTRRLLVEELEPKLLPSTASLVRPFNPGGPVILPMGTGQPSTAWQTLKGKANGSYTLSSFIVDAGPQYHFNGQGIITPFGVVTVTGMIQGVGFIRYGRAQGTVTLTGKNGSVTLELTGPTQSGFSPIPTHFTYNVVSGMGAFQNYKAAGALDLQFSPWVVIDPLPPIIPLSHAIDRRLPNIQVWPKFGGTFTFSIHPNNS